MDVAPHKSTPSYADHPFTLESHVQSIWLPYVSVMYGGGSRVVSVLTVETIDDIHSHKLNGLLTTQ